MDEVYQFQTPGMHYSGSFESDTPQSNNNGSYEAQYTTSINELIAQPNYNHSTTAQYFLATLYKLSEYLFRKKNLPEMHEEENLSFDEYLHSVSDEISIYDNLHKKSKKDGENCKVKKLEEVQHESELMECYDRVPYIYFEKRFVLDFGDLRKNPKEMRSKQEKLNDDLDLVEINLFSQIHFKFHEYFKVVANFDYLGHSLHTNIAKIKEARFRINKVQSQFVVKSVKLRKKIVERQNLEKTIKLLKIIKSLKKLPSVIKEILESSLPYQCLSLLKSTKETLNQTQGLICLTKTSKDIRENESLVQMGLTKRYADELYIYLEECQNVNLQEIWDRINSHNCMDMSMNGSQISGLGHSTFLEESFLDMQPSSTKNKRNEGKEYEIAMILLQSYRFIDFPNDMTRIKVANSLRVFSKRFDQELGSCLREVLEIKKEKLLENDNCSQELKDKVEEFGKNDGESDLSSTENLVEKVTLIFYVKHLHIFNEIMKDTIHRFLGYLQTLLSEYKETIVKNEEKFVQIFQEELTILPSISRILIDKLKYMMSLKNISGVGLNEFKQWIGLLQYWQKYTDSLIDDHSLINYEGPIPGLQNSIEETLKKMIQILNIGPTINELSLSFITSYHNNILNTEIHPALIDESWQSIEIPNQFMDVLNNISQWENPQVNQNISITILNQSTDKSLVLKDSALNKSTASQDDGQNKKQSLNKFRVLKNSVYIDGSRYKISVSLMLLIEFIEEYVKIGRSLKDCHKFIYERMFDLVDTYNNRSKQLILDAKARQYEKMKAKNISAKHLCLLHNCISVLIKLLEQMSNNSMKDLLSITVDGLVSNRKKVLEKLSTLLRGKVDMTINKHFTSEEQNTEQTNVSLLNVFVQMMGIIDDYLNFEDKKFVFKDSMHLFITRYFKELLLKGKQLVADNRILLQKMRFLRQYFPEELDVMHKEVEKMKGEDQI